MILASHGIISSSGAAAIPSTLLNNLVASWKSESNANDSLSTYNGTALGGLTYTTGKSGNAFNFNGSTSYVDFGDVLDLGLSSWSYSFWFNATSITDYTSLFSKALAGSVIGRIAMYFESGKLTLFCQPEGGTNIQLSTSTTISTNTWYHVTAIVDRADKLKIYLNGNNEVGTSSGNNLTLNPTSNFNNACKFRIGCYTASDNTTPSSFFNGKIDEFNVHNRVLTQSEITELQTKYYPF